jgi:hypothetical protein
VTDSHLWLIPVPGEGGDVFRLVRWVERRAAPLELDGTNLRLFVAQTIEVVPADFEDDLRCQTESYTYRLQTSEDRRSSLVRWEYHREPPRSDYPYTPAHVHLDARFVDHDRATDELHIPTARVALEQVVWHLIAEWGVEPRTAEWMAILRDSIKGFHERRTVH